MKKIIQVIQSDAKRILSNVVALVIALGLGIIPALYAWFNIMSNWDPYGKDATSAMKIAVFSMDEGVEYGDVHLNIGNKVIEGLQSNDTIGWVFSESRDDALEGVYSSEYYAAFIVPENFTEDMLSFLNGDPVNPQIEYYENSKKNAIATKITSKVKITVQQSVNTSVVVTLTEMTSKTGEVLTGKNYDGTDLVSGTMTKLKEMDRNLSTYVSILDTLALLSGSASDLVGTTKDLIPGVENMLDSSQSALAGMQDTVLAGGQTAQTISAFVDVSLTSISNQLNSLSLNIKIIGGGTGTPLPAPDMSSLDRIANSTFDLMDLLGCTSQKVQDARDTYTQLSSEITQLNTDYNKTQADIAALCATIEQEISACQMSIEGLRTDFSYKITPAITNTVLEIESSLIQTQAMLSSLDDSFPQINSALADYQTILKTGGADIATTRETVASVKEKLDTVIDTFEVLSEDEQYQEIIQILSTDPSLIASFVASPVSMETVKFYEIKHYGSAMAAFYTVLALWVGALISVALIKVKVKPAHDIDPDTKEWQKFFGRYFAFFLLGQAQTLVTVLGDLFFVEIDCAHPFLFWLSSAVISTCFTLLMYALTYAFGNVGQAVAVIVMVIQVAGAGGTFPVEVLPKAFQVVYRFMPFAYSLGALRECVGGIYHFALFKNLMALLIFMLLSVLLGLFCGRPFKKLSKDIELSKKKSGVLM